MEQGILRPIEWARFAAERYQKVDLASSPRLQLGLNCFEPGQSQPVHGHEGQDKFYLVVSGTGTIRLAEETTTLGPGEMAWAPAGVPHGVDNDSDGRLVLLVGMAPAPGA